MKTAHINIGSNLGDRTANISRAVALLRPLGRVSAVSSPVETPAWGYDSPNAFLNVGVNLETEHGAEELIDAMQRIEREIEPEGRHRNADGSYRDRAVDLDLICLDSEEVATPRLTLPHPRLALREFVLRPMAEVLPAWRHPQTGLTARKMLEALCNIPRQGALNNKVTT